MNDSFKKPEADYKPPPANRKEVPKNKTLQEVFHKARSLEELKTWVGENNTPFENHAAMCATLHSDEWFIPMMRYFGSVTKKNFKASKASNDFDGGRLEDIEQDSHERYLTFGLLYIAGRAISGDYGTPEEMFDYLVRKLSPRAKWDARTPDLQGLTNVPRLKGKKLEQAIAEEERRLGRKLSKPEREAMPRRPDITWMPLDGASSHAADDTRSFGDELDFSEIADPVWYGSGTGAGSGDQDREGEYDDRQALHDLMRAVVAHYERSYRGNYRRTIYEVVMKYAELIEEGKKCTLEEVCSEFGLNDEDDVKAARRLRDDMRRMLARRVAKRRPDLIDQIEPDLRRIVRREMQK